MTVDGNLLFEDNVKTLKCSDIIELAGVIEFEFRCSPDQNGRCCEDAETGFSIISNKLVEPFSFGACLCHFSIVLI